MERDSPDVSGIPFKTSRQQESQSVRQSRPYEEDYRVVHAFSQITHLSVHQVDWLQGDVDGGTCEDEQGDFCEM